MTEADGQFRNRGLDEEAHQDSIRNLLERLAAAERKTDPLRGTDTASGKDHEAFSALLTASELVRVVAGWALDHVTGLSLAGQPMLPRQPSKAKQHPDYLTSRSVADDHRHEAAGGKAYRSSDALTVEQKQLVLRNLIFAGAGSLPHWLREEAFQAIDGLAFAETAAILRPAHNPHLKARYRTLRAQLRLIEIWKYRAKVTKSSAEALFAVARATHVGEATLRGWERNLREKLGSLEVTRSIEFAENRASLVRSANERQMRGIGLSKTEIEERTLHGDRYDDNALATAATDLHQALADQAQFEKSNRPD